MGTIAEEISRIQTAKADLKTSIEAKGVSVPSATLIDGYADLVEAIPSSGESEDVTGSQVNSYVASYIAAAKVAYASDPNRTQSIVSQYNAHIEGVRKDQPLPMVIDAVSGNLIVHDDAIDASVMEQVTAGDKNVYNVSPQGGEYVIDNNGIAKVGRILPTGVVRMINGDTVLNVRDMGGWDCDGGKVKYGKIYRGGDLNGSPQSYLSDASKKMFVDFLRIKSEVDFSEQGSASSFGDNVIYTEVYVNQYYKPQVDLSETNFNKTKLAIQTIFADVANGRPVYFHCSIGRDRTGTLAVILNGMLGVSEVDLDINQELTSFTYSPTQGILSASRTESNYKELISYLKGLTTTSPSSPSYFRDACVAWCVLAGIPIADINAYRHSMIDGDPEDVEAHIEVHATAISVTPSSTSVDVGGTATLTAALTPSDATDTISWATSSASKATVTPSADGKTCVVTGIEAGSVTITASANGHSSSCSIEVGGVQPIPEGHSTPQGTTGIACYINGARRYYTSAEYESVLLPYVLGVYVNTTNTHVILYPTINSGVMYSSNKTVIIPNVTCWDPHETAVNDFFGLDNTNGILAAVSDGVIEDAPLAQWARSLSMLGNPTMYAIACGELKDVKSNLSAVNTCRTLIGHPTIDFESDVWTSTQKGASSAEGWFIADGTWRNHSKNNICRGIACCAITE